MNQQSHFDDKGQVRRGPGPSEQAYTDAHTRQGSLLLWSEEQAKLKTWNEATSMEVNHDNDQ